jgi:hypothetical protein
VNLGVGEPHVGLGLLRLGGRALVLVAQQGTALHRDLLGVRLGQRHRGPLRLNLLVEGLDARLGRVKGRSRLVEFLRRHHFLLHQLPLAVQRHLRIFQRCRGFSLLRHGGGQRGLGLLDLFGRLALLEAQRRFAFLDL